MGALQSMNLRALICLLCTGLFFAETGAAKADDRCQQLEALHRQYAGVALTADQKRIKRQLVAWYNKNCKQRRASAGG
jgi:hypothetical protein